MRESCLVYCYSGIQSLFEVVLLYTFYTIPTFGSSVNFIFFLFQPHRNRGVKDGYQILSWDKSQNQVILSLSTIISYLQRSNVLWCPTLVLLSQTRFLLLLSGSYGYDRSCWFQAKMIINIRNELPSSCLGSSHKKKHTQKKTKLVK